MTRDIELAGAGYGTFAAPVSGMRCLSNIKKQHKAAVLHAIATTGQSVEWRDEPDHRMPASMATNFGSVWSAVPDCSVFWRAYDEAVAQSEATP